MLVISTSKSEDGKRVFTCSLDGRNLYECDDLTIAYTKSPSGCTLLKHGPKDLVQDYFQITRDALAAAMPELANTICLVVVGDARAEDLTHAVNTSAIPEENFLKLSAIEAR